MLIRKSLTFTDFNYFNLLENLTLSFVLEFYKIEKLVLKHCFGTPELILKEKISKFYIQNALVDNVRIHSKNLRCLKMLGITFSFEVNFANIQGLLASHAEKITKLDFSYNLFTVHTIQKLFNVIINKFVNLEAFRLNETRLDATFLKPIFDLVKMKKSLKEVELKNTWKNELPKSFLMNLLSVINKSEIIFFRINMVNDEAILHSINNFYIVENEEYFCYNHNLLKQSFELQNSSLFIRKRKLLHCKELENSLIVHGELSSITLTGQNYSYNFSTSDVVSSAFLNIPFSSLDHLIFINCVKFEKIIYNLLLDGRFSPLTCFLQVSQSNFDDLSKVLNNFKISKSCYLELAVNQISLSKRELFVIRSILFESIADFQLAVCFKNSEIIIKIRGVEKSKFKRDFHVKPIFLKTLKGIIYKKMEVDDDVCRLQIDRVRYIPDEFWFHLFQNHRNVRLKILQENELNENITKSLDIQLFPENKETQQQLLFYLQSAEFISNEWQIELRLILEYFENLINSEGITLSHFLWLNQKEFRCLKIVLQIYNYKITKLNSKGFYDPFVFFSSLNQKEYERPFYINENKLLAKPANAEDGFLQGEEDYGKINHILLAESKLNDNNFYNLSVILPYIEQLQTLDLSYSCLNNHYGYECLDMISSNKIKLENLKLKSCNLLETHLKILCDIIENNKFLCKVDLSNNYLNNNDGCKPGVSNSK